MIAQILIIRRRILDGVMEHGSGQDARVTHPEEMANDKTDAKHMADIRSMSVLAYLWSVRASRKCYRVQERPDISFRGCHLQKFRLPLAVSRPLASSLMRSHKPRLIQIYGLESGRVGLISSCTGLSLVGRTTRTAIQTLGISGRLWNWIWQVTST